MKKLLLLFVAFATITLSAQTVHYSDDFDDLDITDWTLIDADGDTNNWSAVQIQDAGGAPVGTPLLRSASWATSPLTPDNWVISPAIDLTGQTAATLKWQVMAIDTDWDIENYTVYVAAGNTVADFMASTVTFNEATLDGVNVLTDRTLDISSFDGQAVVHFAFRHHNVSDQFTMEVDNVSVEVAATPIVISLIGEGAPGNDASWSTDTDLTDIGGGLYELIGATLYDAELKFRQDHDWTTAWGPTVAPGFPMGTGDSTPGGANITATAGTYNVAFDLNTLNYLFTAVASIEDLAAVGFTYQPNPVNDVLTMNAKNNISNINVFNVLGQSVLQVSPDSLESKLDVSNLPAGAYFVQAQVGNNKGTFKIIKK